MSGMFYSLQEAAGRLNKTAEELKEIVKQGKLREFRDGSNVAVKVDEVEALVSKKDITTSPQAKPTKEPTPKAPEIEIPELEGQEPETLETLDLETPAPEAPAAGPRIPVREVPAAKAVRPEETAAIRPRTTLAPHWEAGPRIKRTVYPQRLSVRQWFIKGLRADDAVAVIVLCLLLCTVLCIFAISGYFIYTILRPSP